MPKQVHAGIRLPPACVRYLLGSLFEPGEGGNMFLRNDGPSPTYISIQPRRPDTSEFKKILFQQVNKNARCKNSCFNVGMLRKIL
jgi:hypothetical protein